MLKRLMRHGVKICLISGPPLERLCNAARFLQTLHPATHSCLICGRGKGEMLTKEGL